MIKSELKDLLAVLTWFVSGLTQPSWSCAKLGEEDPWRGGEPWPHCCWRKESQLNSLSFELALTVLIYLPMSMLNQT